MNWRHFGASQKITLYSPRLLRIHSLDSSHNLPLDCVTRPKCVDLTVLPYLVTRFSQGRTGMLLCTMVSARGAVLERQLPLWLSCTSSSLSLLETVSFGHYDSVTKMFVWALISKPVVCILTHQSGALVDFPFELVFVEHIGNPKVPLNKISPSPCSSPS